MRRLQFSIRSIILLTLAFSWPIVAAVGLSTRIQDEDVLKSPLLVVAGILGVILFASLGDALGQSVGAIVGSLVAAAIWIFVLFGLLHLSSARDRNPLAVHSVVAGITCAGVAASVLLRPKRPSRTDSAAETVSHLLTCKRQQIADDVQTTPEEHGTSKINTSHLHH